MSNEPYHVVRVCDDGEDYDELHGPNGVLCHEGAPEDNTLLRNYWPAVDELNRLQALNAELLGALQHVVEDLDLPDSNYSALEREAIKHARAAIAKATEE